MTRRKVLDTLNADNLNGGNKEANGKEAKNHDLPARFDLGFDEDWEWKKHTA